MALIIIEISCLVIKNGVYNKDFFEDYDQIIENNYEFLYYDSIENLLISEGLMQNTLFKALTYKRNNLLNRKNKPINLAKSDIISYLNSHKKMIMNNLLQYNDLFRLKELEYIQILDTRRAYTYFIKYLYNYHPISVTFIKIQYYQNISVKIFNFFLKFYLIMFFLSVIYSKNFQENLNIFGYQIFQVKYKIITMVTVIFMADLCIFIINIFITLPIESKKELNESLTSDMISCFINRKSVFKTSYIKTLHFFFYIISIFSHFVVIFYCVNFCGFYLDICYIWFYDALFTIILSLLLSFIPAILATISRSISLNFG